MLFEAFHITSRRGGSKATRHAYASRDLPPPYSELNLK